MFDRISRKERMARSERISRGIANTRQHDFDKAEAWNQRQHEEAAQCREIKCRLAMQKENQFFEDHLQDKQIASNERIAAIAAGRWEPTPSKNAISESDIIKWCYDCNMSHSAHYAHCAKGDPVPVPDLDATKLQVVEPGPSDWDFSVEPDKKMNEDAPFVATHYCQYCNESIVDPDKHDCGPVDDVPEVGLGDLIDCRFMFIHYRTDGTMTVELFTDEDVFKKPEPKPGDTESCEECGWTDVRGCGCAQDTIFDERVKSFKADKGTGDHCPGTYFCDTRGEW